MYCYKCCIPILSKTLFWNASETDIISLLFCVEIFFFLIALCKVKSFGSKQRVKYVMVSFSDFIDLYIPI